MAADQSTLTPNQSRNTHAEGLDGRGPADSRIPLEAQEGMTRQDNAQVSPDYDPARRTLSLKMKIALFLTIAAVFVGGPLLVLFLFGGLESLF